MVAETTLEFIYLPSDEHAHVCLVVLRQMAEITPVVLPDEGDLIFYFYYRQLTIIRINIFPFINIAGEAGSAWRLERLRDFEWRAKCLGLADDPSIAALVEQIKQETLELEELWRKQKEPDYERKWWQDGDYDEQRADAANDQGLLLFKQREYGEAFHHFTEAIRLHPTSSVYHCNRAAAALKLGRPDVAAEDAENSLARDPRYLRALLRAGQARIQLKHPDQAEWHFQRALEVDPACTAAQRGIAEAAALVLELRNHTEAQQAMAAAGSRPALPRTAGSSEDAALQLISADQVLATNPSLETAKCSKIEALIILTRYPDALAACSELLPGMERLYLEAEARWRDGDVANALIHLDQGLAERKKSLSPVPAKCAELQEFLRSMHSSMEAIEGHIEDGLYLDVIESCTTMLTSLDSGSCCGLYRKVLRYKADAAASRSQWEAARDDLDKVLEMQPSDSEALRLRADVHKKTGNYLEYFLDVQRLKKVGPDAPGLGALLEDAAKLCSQHPGSNSTSGDTTFGGMVSGPGSAFEVLGLRSGAAPAEVRKAYLRLAAEWHPDKWNSGNSEEMLQAEETFKKVKAAYETLSGSTT